MKKFIFFTVLSLLVLNLFSTDLYIRKYTYSEINNWDALLASITEEAKKSNINIIDYSSLIFADDNEWGPTDEEEIKRLENEIEKLKKTNEELSLFSFHSRPGSEETPKGNSLDDRINSMTEKIEKLKNRIANRSDRNACFPQLYINVNGSFEDSYSVNFSLQLESDSIPYNAYENNFFPSRLNISEQEFLFEYIKAFFPLLKTSKQKNKPEIIDSRVVEINDTKGRSPVFALAPKNDYSFVIRRGAIIENYSDTWDLKSSLTSKLPKTESTYKWKPFSGDGKNIVFGMPDNPNIFAMNNKSQISAENQYKYPEITDANIDYLFSSSGKPVIKAKKFSSGDITLYFPQNDESTKSLLLSTRWWDNVFLGPKNTIWVSDAAGTVYILTQEGQLQKIIHMPLDNSILVAVLNDGTFLTVSEKGLSRHKNNGHILWSLPMEGELKAFSFVAGARNGMYYLFDRGSQKVIRIAEADAPIPPVLAAIRDNNNKLHNGSLNEKAKANLAIANAYYENKSYSSALKYYNEYLQLSPADAKTAEKKLLCEVNINKKSANSRTKKAIQLLDEYGEETAKEEYQKAMKLLEKLNKQVPWDMEVQNMYSELKSAFSNGEEITRSRKLELEISEVDLIALFPALISVYANTPSGFMEVKNTSSETVKNISVTSNIRKYMDFPSSSDMVPELKSGESIYIPIKTILNQSVLNLKEATPVQMQLTLKWESNNKNYSTQVTRPVTIYKSSALTWADTAMASCFIQPNDPMVTNFISKALSVKMNNVLSTNLTKAIKIADALGSIPLTYMSDPTTPATQVIDNEFAIDTIRLPSETLKLKGGDCDDMTTLFCSLMEGTSINSAFITTPGHIFAAFDTGLSFNDIFTKLNKDYLIFEVNGNAWIPVECTILSEGFEKAWTTASKEIGKNPFEVTTISEAWETYSSIPAESSSKEISINAEKIAKMNQTSSESLTQKINSSLNKINIDTLTLSEMNFVAKLYHLNRNDNKAIEVLKKIVTAHPDYVKGYTNLANIYESIGDKKVAALYREKAGKASLPEKNSKTITARASDLDSNDFVWAE